MPCARNYCLKTLLVHSSQYIRATRATWASLVHNTEAICASLVHITGAYGVFNASLICTTLSLASGILASGIIASGATTSDTAFLLFGPRFLLAFGCSVSGTGPIPSPSSVSTYGS